MEEWREVLTITPEFIGANETFVAVVRGQIVGFYALHESAEKLCLEHLWILPMAIGQGIDRDLFQHAVARAKSSGAPALTIEADPNAESFYRRMGAERVGSVVSEVDGQRRELPLLLYDLCAKFVAGVGDPGPLARKRGLAIEQ